VEAGLDRAGRSPLHYAALEGRATDVRDLLEGGAEVDLADKAGFTPLHFAAQELHADVARMLINAGASVHRRNRYGNTPLWTALCNVRDTEGAIVHVLLESGSDPDAENESAVSPRALASRVANYDLMRFFRP
jgi:ankyrin repeat protein